MAEKKEKQRKSEEKKQSEKLTITIGKKLGSGSFGQIRLAKYGNRNEEVAIKLELKDTKSPTLHLEYKYYRILGPVYGIPQIFYFGSCGKYNALVMQRLGLSLINCFKMAGSKFTPKTTIQVALQMLDRIEFVHSKGIVYRDIKPENFIFGFKETDKKNLYIIDFGLAKEYKDPLSDEHIPFKTGKSMTGTARYMSIRGNSGCEQSRRDDMEAIGHTLIFFLRGTLPWQNLTCEPAEKCRRICEVKQTTDISKMCENIPDEFGTYLSYCRKLSFRETPDYNYARKLFTDLFKKNRYKEDNVYDWDQKTERTATHAPVSNKSIESARSLRTESQIKRCRSKTERLHIPKKAKEIKKTRVTKSKSTVKKTRGSSKDSASKVAKKSSESRKSSKH